jgi:hypothetical protein
LNKDYESILGETNVVYLKNLLKEDKKFPDRTINRSGIDEITFFSDIEKILNEGENK